MFGSKLTLFGRIGVSLVVITGVMSISFVLLALVGRSRFGILGVESAAVACGVCWVSGVVAILSVLLFGDPAQSVQGLLFGMMFRMGLPLVVGLGLMQSRSDLLRAGVAGMMIGVYQLGLFVETLLAWWIVKSRSGAAASELAKAS